MHDVVHIVIAEAVRLCHVVPVIGQLVGIETVGEDTFARGGNPECAIVIYFYIGHHCYFAPFFGVFEELPAFSALGIKQTYAILGGDN